jgi:hypothetical protein
MIFFALACSLNHFDRHGRSLPASSSGAHRPLCGQVRVISSIFGGSNSIKEISLRSQALPVIFIYHDLYFQTMVRGEN